MQFIKKPRKFDLVLGFILQKDCYLPVYYKLIVQFLTSIVPYLLWNDVISGGRVYEQSRCSLCVSKECFRSKFNSQTKKTVI